MKTDERQIEALEKLARMLGHEKDGAALLKSLRRLEKAITSQSVKECNGEITSGQLAAKKRYAEKRIEELFGAPVPGFFVNGDPRGYALKIEDSIERDTLNPKGIYLYRDVGGYGILAPEREAV